MSRRHSDLIAELLAEQPVDLGTWTGPRGAIVRLRLEPDGSYTVFLRDFDGEPFPPSVRITDPAWCRVCEELRHSFPCYRETPEGAELLPPPG